MSLSFLPLYFCFLISILLCLRNFQLKPFKKSARFQCFPAVPRLPLPAVLLPTHLAKGLAEPGSRFEDSHCCCFQGTHAALRKLLVPDETGKKATLVFPSSGPGSIPSSILTLLPSRNPTGVQVCMLQWLPRGLPTSSLEKLQVFPIPFHSFRLILSRVPSLDPRPSGFLIASSFQTESDKTSYL